MTIEAQPDQQQTQQPTTPAIAWLPDADQDTTGYVGTKGWQGPADVLKSYQNLEKMFGADKAGRTVTVPTSDDPKDWDQVWQKLGRPQTPDDYKITVPDGADAELLKSARSWFHEAGLSDKAAQLIASKWMETNANRDAAEKAAEQAALQAENLELEKEWGSKVSPSYQVQMELAKRAAKHHGMNEAEINALESVVGYSKVFKILASMGKANAAESQGHGLDQGGSGFAMTPSEAKSRRQQLLADRDWGSRAMKTGSKESAELEKLNQIIAANM